MSGPEGTKRPWLSWTAPPQASAPCKLHPLLSQGILAYIWSALWPVLRSASCVFHHWPSGMDPKAVLQVVLCLVLALLFLLCCKIYGIGSHVSKVGFYFLDCAPWPEPRSSSHFVWSGNISGTGHCHCPSPAYGQRGEAIALSLLELTSALVLFPWVQQWPSNSSVTECKLLRRAGPDLEVFWEDLSVEKRAFLVNCVNRKSICRKDQQKKEMLLNLLIYGLTLNKLCNNGICSHNTYWIQMNDLFPWYSHQDGFWKYVWLGVYCNCWVVKVACTPGSYCYLRHTVITQPCTACHLVLYSHVSCLNGALSKVVLHY